MRLTRWIYLVLVTIVAIQCIHYYPRLPERLATHFDVRGQPNDWMSKSGFLIIFVLLLAITTGVLGGIAFLMRALPDAFINLPHKREWLAPARRDETHAWIQRQMEWVAVATFAFLVGVLQLIIHVNLQDTHQLPMVSWIGLGLYTLFILLWAVRFIMHFSKRPSGPDPRRPAEVKSPLELR